MDTPSGIKDSISAWIKFSVQAPGEIPYNGIYYDPPEEVPLANSPSKGLLSSVYHFAIYFVNDAFVDTSTGQVCVSTSSPKETKVS